MVQLAVSDSPRKGMRPSYILPAHLLEQLGERLSGVRITRIGPDLEKRNQCEGSLTKPGVRDAEPRVVEHDVLHEEEVEIDLPGPQRNGSPTPQGALDAVEHAQKLERRQIRLHEQRRVEEIRLG